MGLVVNEADTPSCVKAVEKTEESLQLTALSAESRSIIICRMFLNYVTRFYEQTQVYKKCTDMDGIAIEHCFISLGSR
jgi:hypothetical protein